MELVNALVGGADEPKRPACLETQCCGSGKEKNNNIDAKEIEDICVDSTKLEYTDAFGTTYTHTCMELSVKLMGAVAAAATMCTSLM